MKYKGEISELTVTQTNLGRALGLSQQRIGQLIDENIVVRDEQDRQSGVYLFDSLKNYYLSKNVTGSGVDFWKERGLHERAKRQLAELKVRQTEGELYVAEEVEQTLSELAITVRNNLLGLPAKLAPLMAGKGAEEINSILTSELEDALQQLTMYNSM